MDTPYTQGFKAGLAWEKDRIIKLLENWDREKIWIESAIALIRGETDGN